MSRCPSCSHPVAETSRFCPDCGAGLDLSSTPTGTAPQPAARTPATPASRPGSSGESARPGPAARSARFVPGDLLAGRYRIVDLVGKGGMGEIYRADDLTLGQPVALKFLPLALQDDLERQERFFNEVRVARQISHPAVCRVHDVGSVNGQHFLSMEYVDGEDLASLLRRIGRLPADKALEIARQICAGLGAAHERGMLHRDLKPENIMLDGRGKVRLTDFGLAGVAEAISGDDVRSGTPAYMSPEQIAGREVTARSDVYALGLVLYELFTGRKVFEGRTFVELARQHREETPAAPSSLVEDLDLAVERVILRCLEKDPRARPASALAVAAALPGGDPLAAALAAGETPSPEVVAAAGQAEGLRPSRAWTCLVTIAACLAAAPFLAGPLEVFRVVPFEKPPAVLEDRARELAQRLGHSDSPADRVVGYSVDKEYFLRVEGREPSPQRWTALATGQPPVVQFWYRQSPRPLLATNMMGKVFWSEPAFDVSGMVGIRLDTRGALVGFYAVPPQVEEEGAARGEPVWSSLFGEAWLDPARFQPVAPRWTPPFFCDARAAWEGTWPERPDIPLRIEAASYRGRPVFFQMISPWTRPERMQPFIWTPAQRAGEAGLLGLLLAVAAGAGLLARRNIRIGRGDRRGAFRLAGFTFAMAMATWALVAAHVRTRAEVVLLLRGAGLALLLAFLIWLFYLALEPYVRRLWPHTIVSWMRLLGGGLRDPLVGRDILVGVTAGAALVLLLALAFRLPSWVGRPPLPPVANDLDALLGWRPAVGGIFDQYLSATTAGMGLLLGLLLMRLLLRRERTAALAFVVLLAVLYALLSPLHWSLALPLQFVIFGTLTLVLLRAGLLACIVTTYVLDTMVAAPLTPDLAHWTGAPTLLVLAVIGALAIHGFRTALAGQPLFGPSGLPE